MRERALITCVAGFLLGVLYASIGSVTMLLIGACVGCAAICLLAARCTQRAHPLYVVFLLAAFVFGSARFDIARVVPDPVIASHVGERIAFQGQIIAEPDVRERSTRLTIETERGTHVLVIAPPFIRAVYGDHVAVSGKVTLPESFETGQGRSFDYPAYLRARGITHSIEFADVEVRSHGGNVLVRAALAIKALYLNGLRATLPEPYAGLAAGITAGDKRSVGSELSDVFMRVSLIHILVLSGYNITVVMSALLRALGGVSRGPKLIVSLGTVLFFILISGAAASSIRAGAMAFAAVFAHMYGRRFVALRVLVAIVVVMVLWNPYILAFDPGFQLSVLATAGLILFAGDISQRLRFVPEHFGAREIAASTIATQLTVLPLLLYQNGNLSLVSLPANVLALIAVPFAMACSAIAAVAGMLFGTWGVVAALPAYALLRYIVFVAETFADTPHAALVMPSFSAWWLLLVYAAYGACALYMRSKTAGTCPAVQ